MSMDVQRLEDRLALAVNFVIMPLTSGTTSLASPAFAYDIVINDNPNTPDAISNPLGSGFGTGQDAYIRGGTSNLLLSDNSSFLNAIPLTTLGGNTINFGSGTSTSIGAPSTLFVSTGDYQSRVTATLGSVSGTATAGGVTLTNLNVNAERTFTIGQTLDSANITGGTSTITAINSPTSITIAGTFIAAGTTNLELGLPTAAAQPFSATSGMTAVATTAGSTTITMASTAQLRVGMLVTGSGMAGGTYVTAIPNGTDATINQSATLTNTAAYLKFSAGLNGTQIFQVGTGQYRFYLPIPYPHAVSGSVASSATTNRFDFGAFGLSPSGANSNGNNIGLQAVTQPSPTAYAAPVCGGNLNTMTNGYDTARNASFITFNFFSSATGNARLDVNSLNISLDPYVASRVTNAKPESVTIVAGQTVNQRFMVDFAVPNSTININSPLVSQADANNPGIIDFYEPIDLTATNININQDTTSLAQLSIGRFNRNLGVTSPLYGPEFFRAAVAGFGTGVAPPVSTVNVNSTVSAANYRIQVDGQTPTPGTSTPHGSFTVSQQGSLVGASGGTSSAGDVTFNALYTDLRYLGDVRAVTQNYLITATGSADQYDFTTRDAVTGNQSGLVVADTLVMTLSAPQGGTVDLNTSINTLRFDSGSADDIPYNYAVAVSDAGALVVNAVAASSGPIVIQAAGDLTVSNAAVQTAGDITLQSGGTLSVAGNIVSGNGLVSLVAPSLALTGTLTSGGIQGASLTSTTGGTSAAALVRAGGVVRRSVRLASERDYTLTALVPGAVFGGTTTTGTAASGASTVTLGSLTGLSVGMTVTAATGIAAGTKIQTIDVANSQVTLDTPTTAALANTSLTFGFALVAGDRILLKNESVASLNGIYVVQAAGSPVRATDANTSASFVAGMNVLVREGTQEGEWTFQNVASVNLGTSNLQFVPSTATRTYGAVDASNFYVLGVDVATTAAQANLDLTTCGLAVIDGVTVTAGQRVLVKNQTTNPAENGLYIASTGPWSRASDADTPTELLAGGYVYVAGGATQATQAFALAQDVLAVGTSPVTFSPFVVQSTRTSGWSPIAVLDDVAVATTVNIDLATGGLLTIDGVALTAGQRVLVKNQINATQNGVYVVAAGSWSRATDVPAAGTLARDAAAYVLGGTQNAGTTWQFNDATRMRGTIAANTPNVTGLLSTAALTAGMLVTGPGIPAGTKIQTIGTNGTSLVLTANAIASGTVAISFVKDTTVTVGVDPLPFIPAGGVVDVTAATTIGGTGRYQGSTALLTAGTSAAAATSTINVLSNVGRMSAIAPGAITLDNSTAMEIELAQTTLDGGISANAAGTLTALSVSAAAAGATARPVTLTSTYGDVVAESVTAAKGDISAVSYNGSIAFTKARRATSNVSAIAGSINATADSASGVITVDGRLLAQGTSADVVLASNLGRLAFTSNAIVTVADQLKITTPNSMPTVASGAAITAARLSLTSQFATTASGTLANGSAIVTGLASTSTLLAGMLVSGMGIPVGATILSVDSPTQITLSANATAAGVQTLSFSTNLSSLGTYQVIDINRTDTGNLAFTSPSSLTVEGATTTNGSIILAAPDITVTGPIASQGASTDVTLTASAGNLVINSPITALRDIILSAPAGEIGGSLTQTATANLSSGSAVVTNLASTAALSVGMRVSGTGIPPVSGGLPAGTCIVSIDSATQVTLSAPASASGTGVTLTFTSPTALLTAPRNVSATASSAARLTMRAAALTNTKISAGGGYLGVTDTDGLDLTSAAFTGGGTAAFNIGSAALGGTANVGLIDAGATGTVVLTSYGNILGVTPDATADIQAAKATLLTTAGKIRVDTDLDTLTATATQKNQSITINDIGSLQLLSVGSGSAGVGVDVDVTAAGTITATNVLTAGKVTLRATGAAADILVDSVTAAGNQAILQAGNSITEVTPGDANADITATSVSLTATNGDINVYLATSAATATAATAGKTITIKNDAALSVGASSATTMTLNVGGVVSQTAPINAGTLTVNAFNGSDITLTAANTVQAFAASSLSGATRGNITFTDSDASLALGSTTDGIVGGVVKITAVGNVSQTTPYVAGNAINATSLSISTTAGSAISLANPNNSIGTLQSNNGGVLTVSSASGFIASGLSGTVVTINANGDVTQLAGAANAITATTSLTVNNTAGIVRLDNPANSTPSLAISNPLRAVTYTNAGALDIAAAGIQGGAIALTTVGGLTDSGAITGTSLALTNTSTGAIKLDNAANSVTSLTVANATRDVTFTNAAALDVGAAGIQGAAIALSSVGGLTDTGAITGTSLKVTNTGSGAVVLNNAANSVGSLAVANAVGAVTYTNAAALDVAAAGIQGTAITLTTVGGLTDAGSIIGTSLTATNTGSGAILLDNAANSVSALAAVNTGRSIGYTNANALALGPIDGSVVGVTVTGAGDVTQSAAITATSSLNVTTAAGAIALNNAANSVGTFTATSNPAGVAGTGNISYTNAGTFSAGPITAGAAVSGNGSITLTSNTGTLNVVGNLTALNDSVSLNAASGTITFTPGVSVNADILSYATAAGQTPVLPVVRPPIIVANGDLTLTDPSPTNTVLVNGYTVTGNITITSATGFTISGPLTAGAGKAVTLTASTGSIGFAAAGGIFYTTTNGTTTISAAAGTITDVAGTVISGATTSITVGQNMSQQGRINTGSLTVTANNAASVLLSGSNSVDLFAASSVSGGSRGNITLNDITSGLVLGALTGGVVTISGVGAITQSGVIDATTLDVTGSGAAIALNTQNNTIGSFKAANAGGAVSLKDTSSGLDLGAVTGTVVTISGVGAITQSGVINAATLDVTGNGSAITLNTQNNTIGSFKAANAGGAVSLRNTNSGLDLGAVTGTVVTISGVGAITQTGVINATTLDVTGDGSAITLNTQNNTIGVFKAANAGGAVSLKDTSSGLDLGAITGGVVTINGVGAIIQSGVINATTLDVTGTGSAITLNTQNNAIGTFSATNGAGAVAVKDTAGGLELGTITSGKLTVAAAGAVGVTQTRVIASGDVAISTSSGGLNVVGPQPGGLLQSATKIDLSQVSGTIALVSGGLIVAPTIIGNGQNIQVGGVVTTAADLSLAFTTVNSLSPITGSTYEIVVGANIAITSGLVANRAITLRGNNDAPFTISNGGTVATGLTIAGTAGGTTVRNLAFSGFAANAILVNGGTLAQANRVTLSNLSINNSGTTGAGLNFTGTGTSTFFTGSTVQKCTFSNSPYALRLASAQGVTFGGTVAGQANTINGSSKAGIFASGFCTNSSVIKTVFTNTKTPYSTATSRNLRIVK